MTVLAFVVVLAGLVVAVTCAIGGGVELLMVVRRQPELDGYPSLIHAAVQLIAAVALTFGYFVSARMAESSTGWADPDGDGMEGQMVNGRYDYLDINGDTLIQIWGLLTASVLACLFFSLRLVAHRSRAKERAAAHN